MLGHTTAQRQEVVDVQVNSQLGGQGSSLLPQLLAEGDLIWRQIGSACRLCSTAPLKGCIGAPLLGEVRVRPIQAGEALAVELPDLFAVPMFDAFMVRAMPEWRQRREE